MSKAVKIAIIVTDNPIYKNDFIDQLVKARPDNIGFIGELNFKHPQTDTKTHYKKFIELLGLKGLIVSVWFKVMQAIKTISSGLFNGKNGYTLKQIAKKNKVPYFDKINVNSPAFIQLLKDQQIDYIINSGNQIYRKKILAEYQGRIINRHSSCLPKYGGIYPIFWQLLHEQELGGVTLHWIDAAIDKGQIAYQQAYKMQPSKSLFWHYKKVFEISLDLCIQAIDDLNNGKKIAIEMTEEASYFSWPQKDDIKAYRKKGLKIA